MEYIKCYNKDGRYVCILNRESREAKKYWCDIVIACIANLRTNKVYLQIDTENKLQLTAGGHVQYNEDIYVAIEREVMEETGINIDFCNLIKTFSYKDYKKKQIQYYFIYSADISLKSLNILDTEEIKNFLESNLNRLAEMKYESGYINMLSVDGLIKHIDYPELLNAFNGKYVMNKILDILVN